MDAIEPPLEPATVGGFDAQGRALVVFLFALGGTLVGSALPWVVRWAADVRYVPLRGPMELLGAFDQQWLIWGRPFLGLLAGLALAWWVVARSPVLEIDDAHITVRRHGKVLQLLERSSVAAVFPERARTVIVAHDGRRLFDDEVECDEATARDAFVRCGYPWMSAPD